MAGMYAPPPEALPEPETLSRDHHPPEARNKDFVDTVGGGVRIHPENARMSGRHGVQYVAQCVACAALTPVVWQ